MSHLLCTINGTVEKPGDLSENCTNGTGFNHPYPEGLQNAEEIMRIISIIFYVSILVISSLGNSCIIAVVMSNKSMQSKANVLIINMAVSDLLATTFALPRMLDVSITGNYQWKAPDAIAEVACKLGPFVREFSCAVSIFSLVGIAVDRFFAIVIPLVRKPRLLELRYLISVICFTSMAANAIYLYSFQITVKPFEGGLVCYNILTNKQEKIFDTFRFVTFIAVPFLVLVSIYGAIARKVGQQAIPGTTVQSFASNRRQQNKKIVQLAVAIVIFFFLSWSPYYILLLLSVYVWKSQVPPPSLFLVIFVLQELFTIFTYASFAVNPIICLTFSSNFRRFSKLTFFRSRLHKTLRFTRRATTATQTTNQTTVRGLSLNNLDVSLDKVTGIENQAHTSEEI